MTDIVVQPVIEVEIVPTPLLSINFQTDEEELIAEHEQKPDPHPQYSRDSDLTAHATNQDLHIPSDGITNDQIADDAAIDWSKISLDGAIAADIGAATTAQGSLADTALQPSAIGTIIQAFDSDLSAIAALSTTSFGRSFLTQSNAAAARLLSWGFDIQITGTKPNTRADGSALQTGDRWLDTSERIWWFWNGTYWLSEGNLLVGRWTSTTLAASNSGAGLASFETASNDVFIERFRVTGGVGTNNPSNYWQFYCTQLQTGGGSITEFNIDSASVASGATAFQLSTSPNAHRDVSALGLIQYRLGWNVVGTPGSLVRPTFEIFYRYAKP